MLHFSPSLLTLVAVALFLASHSLQQEDDQDKVSGDLVPPPEGNLTDVTVSSTGGKTRMMGGASTVSPSTKGWCPVMVPYNVYSSWYCSYICRKYGYPAYYWNYPYWSYPYYRCYCCYW
eukprot:GFUD01128207.1.p1 GENE.GFUD01128207.1~~GFUD01128207.1.p1  ORF type:complete len:119 (-),score=22.89 GFUD01128207.1:135-491(-)